MAQLWYRHRGGPVLNLAFGHKARRGKDTCADYLAAKYNFKVLRFAQPLYDIAGDIQRRLGRPVEKDAPLMQKIGSILREYYGEDVFVDALLHEKGRIEAREGPRNFVVADLRYKNELRRLTAEGFVTTRVDRLLLPGMPGYLDRDPNHPSEVDLNDATFDAVFENNGTLEELYGQVEGLLQRHAEFGLKMPLHGGVIDV